MSNIKIYLVGGAVRDKLLGLDPKDKDYVVVGATPNDLLSVGFTQVGADFPVFLHPETKDEYALARIERKTGNGYSGFSCDFDKNVTLKDDLSRRDLTINSMAMDDKNNVIDPYNGQEDLKNKILRHTTNAFREDPVRVLRICRFAARYSDFTIHEDTKKLMKEIVSSGELDHLTKERVWMELKKTFTEAKPSKFFEAMEEVGALKKILPEISAFVGVPQREDYHAEGDVFVHTMMVIDQAARLSKKFNSDEKTEIVSAALFHDLGKAVTPYNNLYHEDGSIKGYHHGHDDDQIVLPILDKIRDRLRLPNDVYKISKDAALLHQKVHILKSMSTRGIVRMFNQNGFHNKGGEKYLQKLLTVCHADALGRLSKENGIIKKVSEKYDQKDIFMEYYNAYRSVNISNWLVEYKIKNEKKPDNHVIQQKIQHERINAVSSIVNKYKKKLKP